MNTKKRNVLVVCGGHMAPALAVIEHCLQSYPEWEIVYFGRMHPLEDDRSVSLEFRTIRSLGIPFYAISSGRLQRHTFLGNIFTVMKIPIGIVQSAWHLHTVNADAIIGFGGYLSAAVCFAGWMLRTPVLIHEQTPVLGLANRLMSRIASVVCVSFAETSRIPAGVKPIVTGNPLRRSFWGTVPSLSFGDRTQPLLYITGGSVGSHGINMLVKERVPDLVKRFRVLHQCGEANNREDFEILTQVKSLLPAKSADNYRLVPFVDPMTVGSIMKEAAVIVSRAGANTVYEIAAAGTPALLIPLPWSADGEQQKNARLLTETGLAVTVDQNDATPDILLRTILDVYNQRNQHRQGMGQARKVFPLHAADRIVAFVRALMENE